MRNRRSEPRKQPPRRVVQLGFPERQPWRNDCGSDFYFLILIFFLEEIFIYKEKMMELKKKRKCGVEGVVSGWVEFVRLLGYRLDFRWMMSVWKLGHVSRTHVPWAFGPTS